MKTVLPETTNSLSRRLLKPGASSEFLPRRAAHASVASASVKPFKKLVAVDAVVRKLVRKDLSGSPAPAISVRQQSSFRRAVNFFGQTLFSKKRFSFAAVATVVLVAFFSGMVTIYQTRFLRAEDQSAAPPVQIHPPIPLAPAISEPISKVSNDVLFNMSIAQLQDFLSQALRTPQMKADALLAERKAKLTAYLTEKQSPFVNIADTLARLKHWQLVLAISNSESTLGKRCYTNNCSGIGVQPGHPLWRTYTSTSDWAKDLDVLLDKRYNNWTLEQMNGVYNKPGSKNWLLAAKQVLEELQERQIE